jgi:hypothetical protein
MEYSSNEIKDYLLDSNNFSQSRCEFRIPHGKNVLTNMKLVGLGCTRTGGNNCSYSRGAGASSVISRISLYDGANLLSECRKFQKQQTFNNLNQSSDANDSRKAPANLNKSNFMYGQVGDYKGYKGVGYQAGNLQVTDSEATTGKGMLQLSDVLPLLNNIKMLDSAVFKNSIRLVIEWETVLQKILVDTSITARTIIEPVLLMTEIIDDDLYKSMKQSGSIQWYERETDQNVYAPSATIQTKKYNGFDNKIVKRLLCAKEQASGSYVSGNDVLGLGRDGSCAMISESVNFINDGRQVFPTNLSLPSEIQRQTVNAWGPICAYQGFDQVTSSNDTQFPRFDLLLADASVRAGDVCYFGLQLGNSRVKQLEIPYNRSVSVAGSLGSNDMVTMHVFGDVAKVINISGNEYQIGYL